MLRMSASLPNGQCYAVNRNTGGTLSGWVLKFGSQVPGKDNLHAPHLPAKVLAKMIVTGNPHVRFGRRRARENRNILSRQHHTRRRRPEGNRRSVFITVAAWRRLERDLARKSEL